jgi:hypothetical protein
MTSTWSYVMKMKQSKKKFFRNSLAVDNPEAPTFVVLKMAASYSVL